MKTKTQNTTAIQLGNKVRCIVTGFTGIVTSRIEYLNGCIQWCVKPPVDKEGKERDGIFIDQQQLEFVDKGIAVEQKVTGGPASGPSSCGLARNQEVPK